MPGAAEFFGDGTHTLPIRAAVLETLGKREGDELTVVLKERLCGLRTAPGSPACWMPGGDTYSGYTKRCSQTW